ncbi:MAG: radical SAM family heme chaperone HemW [Paludibacteraceae bacterium]|nr:radical SAM family heme chaperone HemW [Paludibacteraceae bacterium]MBN2787397.1 radical SAM family heme chaperone HemW [Paludibacteraceae bacterium]
MAGIYIHIPFCKSRCAYCDFFSSTHLSYKSKLVACLCKELISEKHYIGNETVETIYFGGGTPSLLEENDFKLIFDTIQATYDTSNCVEITIEVNPDDVTNDFVSMLKKFPFNRISIGIQSFINNELKLINRRHTSEQAINAVQLFQRNDYENISVDLIYGYPSQDINNLSTSIDKLLKMKIQHISAYHLTYEKGTVLHQKLINNEIQAVDEETSLEMFHLITSELTKNGFLHYEISNFAKNGFESKHNSSYWNGKKYLGIGPSAHSYNNTSRKWNVASITSYIKAIETQSPCYEIEQLSLNDKYNDYIITSLRTLQGCSLTNIKTEFGEIYLKNCLLNITKHLNNNTLQIDSDSLKLTPKGIFLSDGIIADLLAVD